MLKRVVHDTNPLYSVGHRIFCPACQSEHLFNSEPNWNGSKWTFDGNYDKPTFHPSMNIKIGPMPEGHPQAGHIDICHSIVTAGMIEYLADCTHGMAGQTVELKPY